MTTYDPDRDTPHSKVAMMLVADYYGIQYLPHGKYGEDTSGPEVEYDEGSQGNLRFDKKGKFKYSTYSVPARRLKSKENFHIVVVRNDLSGAVAIKCKEETVRNSKTEKTERKYKDHSETEIRHLLDLYSNDVTIEYIEFNKRTVKSLTEKILSNRTLCETCGKLLVDPCGPSRAPVLLLAEFPGYYEVKSGVPWTGPAGDILKKELRRVGIQYEKCRATNLWQHEKDNVTCTISGHWQRTIGELQGRLAVLLMGSEVATHFLGRAVSEVTGTFVKSDLLPKSVKVALAMYNPAICLHDKLGETRLAITRFAEATKKMEDGK